MIPDYQSYPKIIKQIIKHIIRSTTLKDLNLRLTTGLDITLDKSSLPKGAQTDQTDHQKK